MEVLHRKMFGRACPRTNAVTLQSYFERLGLLFRAISFNSSTTNHQGWQSISLFSFKMTKVIRCESNGGIEHVPDVPVNYSDRCNYLSTLFITISKLWISFARKTPAPLSCALTQAPWVYFLWTELNLLLLLYCNYFFTRTHGPLLLQTQYC